MRKKFFILMAMGVFLRTLALPTFEPFADATSRGGSAYAKGEPLFHQINSSGESWADWNGGTATSWVKCTNTSLNYPDFPTRFPTPLSVNAVYLPGQADRSGGVAGQSAALSFSRAVMADPHHEATNAIYASFLLKVSNLENLNSGSPIYFAGFATNVGDENVKLPASAMKIFLKGNSATAGRSSSYSIGVANDSGSSSAIWDGGGHMSNDVVFVVVAYEFGINGNPDAARLWVNPAPSRFDLPFAPPATGSISIASGVDKIVQAADFFLLARSGATLWGGLLIGDLRVGTTWSYVTGGPDTVRPVLSLAAEGGNVFVNAANGAPGATNFLLSSTNALLPVAGWTTAATNLFDRNGRIHFTRPVRAADPQRFYALKALPPPRGNPDLWVPACGAWLGAAVTNGTTQNFSAHEAKIGRQLDVLRIYHTPGSWTHLTTKELNYINAGRKLLLSVKPSSQWSNAVGAANGGSATVDAQMASLAQSISSVKPHKIMLIVWHEPENDVTGGGGPGNKGTPLHYVEMWHNVRDIFDANGATNVIWCWCVQNIAKYRGLIASLWPGNNYVDWVMWDQYADASDTFTNGLQTAYDWMAAHSTPANDYLGKPWGIAEWGVGINNYYPTVAAQTSGINQFNAALNIHDEFPRLKLISYFDELAPALLPGSIPAYSNFVHSAYMTQQCPP